MEPGLSARAIITPAGATYPNGCHICEVEIDPDTGIAEISRYAVVDDVGRVVNPLLLKGQLHGGVVQGAGQALYEIINYDSDNGQLLSGSFMDYCMPRAADFPFFAVASNEVLTKANPLGVKGAGEAGTVGALPAVMNAINDALAPLGIRHFEMPATPERLWRVIRDAQSKSLKKAPYFEAALELKVHNCGWDNPTSNKGRKCNETICSSGSSCCPRRPCTRPNVRRDTSPRRR
jgi:aerobic carbon-monoxide dehydrogenase large subunit